MRELETELRKRASSTEVPTSLWGYGLYDKVEVAIGDEVAPGVVVAIDARRNTRGVFVSLVVWLDGCWMHHVYQAEDVRLVAAEREEAGDGR
ncbi:MAG: hypothetical protein AAFY58_07805 [Planctomycetota bacterium]